MEVYSIIPPCFQSCRGLWKEKFTEFRAQLEVYCRLNFVAVTKTERMLSFLLLLSELFSWAGAIPTESTSDASSDCPAQPRGAAAESLLAGIADGNIVLVDVRTPEELLETGFIPGSHNVPLPEMGAAFALEPEEFRVQYGFEKPSADQLVITCRSGRRATAAWNDLLQLGYCSSRVYFGSFLDWQAKDLPIERVQQS